MVQALLDLDDNTNRVLNVIKAKYDLKDKSQVVTLLVQKYIDDSEDEELKPEFVKEILRIEKEGKFHHFKNMEEFEKRIGLKNVRTGHGR